MFDIEDSQSLLFRAGYLRQAHSGIFHLLPLGLRVQDKLERTIDDHMSRLGASKVALSSITSEDLWTRSGRLGHGASDLFRFHDRKGGHYLLGPTHEEEITALVASTLKSYKELPLRLYQISRKYRDEPRPRQGLLRTREFLMKDLYTFDQSIEQALESYNSVRAEYIRFFDLLKVKYMVAEASSGDMGGKLSHEFHFPSAKGEDHIISCTHCAYVANEEVAQSRLPERRSFASIEVDTRDFTPSAKDLETSLESAHTNMRSEEDPFALGIRVWSAVSKDRLTLVNVFYPSKAPHGAKKPTPRSYSHDVNVHRIKSIFPDLDAGVGDPVSVWRNRFRYQHGSQTPSDAPIPANSQIINIFDYRIPSKFYTATFAGHADIPVSAKMSSYFSKTIPTTSISLDPVSGAPLDLLRIKDDDPCPKCSQGLLRVQRAIELGHTFMLGTRYSDPLRAMTVVPSDGAITTGNATTAQDAEVPLQMGCHGIGISRMIGAIADIMADEKGLNWPRIIAPYDLVIIPSKGTDNDALQVYDALIEVSNGDLKGSGAVESGLRLSIDAVLDDRPKDFAWKLKDADLLGFPVVVILGRDWKSSRLCEVQCRRLGLRSWVAVGELQAHVQSMLEQL
ncbi:MAG: hypothetical protein M1824_003177 [Vezdaea acicularis]|nr:MAG: hypothetical protein M1824_003177 [Vezdaea acicularis]